MPKRSWASAALRSARRRSAAARPAARRPRRRDAHVYVSLPLRGPSARNGRDAADGARLALADAYGEAGGVTVEADYLDDTAADGERGWSAAQAAANARTATQDSASIAFVGDFASGATRASLPITNAADISCRSRRPARAADLVAPFPGSDEIPDTAAERCPDVRPRDPERRRAGARRSGLGRRARRRARRRRSPTARASATRWRASSRRLEQRVGRRLGGPARLLRGRALGDSPWLWRREADG